MDTVVTANIKRGTVCAVGELIDCGRLGEASELLDGSGSFTESVLLKGAVLSYSRPDSAKDLLSEGIRTVNEYWRQRGLIWLAQCCWATGESAEARTILDSFRPSYPASQFVWHLLQSILDSGSANYKYALKHLQKIQDLVDSVNPNWRGKFYNERGFIYRRMGRFDDAILAYEGARISFEEAENRASFAGTANNLAGVYIDTERYGEAHQILDHAIRLLLRAGEQSYLARTYDQKALVFLAERKYQPARRYALKAVAVLNGIEKLEWYGDALVTLGRSLIGLGQWVDAFRDFHEARSIALRVDSNSLNLLIAEAQLEASDSLQLHAQKERLTIALRQSGGSYRAAAQRLNMYHSGFIKAAKKLGITRSPKRPRSIITKRV